MDNTQEMKERVGGNGTDCGCMGWCRAIPGDGGQHHHKGCPLYATEKYPRLFYYDEGIDAWCPAHNDLDIIVGGPSQLVTGEIVEIQFVRRDMTDKEYFELPQD